MKSGSYFNTAENLNKIPKVVRLTVYNPTSAGVYLTPKYSVNNGGRWKGLDSYPYEYYIGAGSTSVVTITSLPTNQPIMLRFQTSGSSDYCFIDDIEICYEATWTPEPEIVPGDVNGNGNVNMDDLTALINYLVYGDMTGIDPVGANVNEVGDINMDDLTALINILVFGHR